MEQVNEAHNVVQLAFVRLTASPITRYKKMLIFCRNECKPEAGRADIYKFFGKKPESMFVAYWELELDDKRKSQLPDALEQKQLVKFFKSRNIADEFIDELNNYHEAALLYKVLSRSSKMADILKTAPNRSRDELIDSVIEIISKEECAVKQFKLMFIASRSLTEPKITGRYFKNVFGVNIQLWEDLTGDGKNSIPQPAALTVFKDLFEAYNVPKRVITRLEESFAAASDSLNSAENLLKHKAWVLRTKPVPGQKFASDQRQR